MKRVNNVNDLLEPQDMPEAMFWPWNIVVTRYGTAKNDVMIGQAGAGVHNYLYGLGGWDPLESTCRHASLSIL